MKARKQGLRGALQAIRRGKLDITRCGLAGCPVGGWPETRQAMSRIEDELPRDRTYTVQQIVDAVYTEDHAGRWQLRD